MRALTHLLLLCLLELVGSVPVENIMTDQGSQDSPASESRECEPLFDSSHRPGMPWGSPQIPGMAENGPMMMNAPPFMNSRIWGSPPWLGGGLHGSMLAPGYTPGASPWPFPFTSPGSSTFDPSTLPAFWQQYLGYSPSSPPSVHKSDSHRRKKKLAFSTKVLTVLVPHDAESGPSTRAAAVYSDAFSSTENEPVHAVVQPPPPHGNRQNSSLSSELQPQPVAQPNAPGYSAPAAYQAPPQPPVSYQQQPPGISYQQQPNAVSQPQPQPSSQQPSALVSQQPVPASPPSQAVANSHLAATAPPTAPCDPSRTPAYTQGQNYYPPHPGYDQSTQYAANTTPKYTPDASYSANYPTYHPGGNVYNSPQQPAQQTPSYQPLETANPATAPETVELGCTCQRIGDQMGNYECRRRT